MCNEQGGIAGAAAPCAAVAVAADAVAAAAPLARNGFFFI